MQQPARLVDHAAVDNAQGSCGFER